MLRSALSRLPFVVLLAACASAPVRPTAIPPVLPFVEDDYAAALADARRHDRPLFVDAWAPWCHSCVSMRAFVFTDPSLAAVAKRVTWLSIDTERPGNAAFVERMGMEAWPTLFVIDPRSEVVVLRWLGSATAEELVKLLDDADRAIHGEAGEWERALAAADAKYGAGRTAEAIDAYEGLLEKVPAGYARTDRVVQSLVLALATSEQPERCALQAGKWALKLPRTFALANVAATGLGCALASSRRDADWAEVVDLLEKSLREALAPPPIALAVDDRSGMYELLVEARGRAHDDAGRLATARAWADELDRAAAAAQTPAERAVFDPHRLLAYLALNEPERAVPMLERSERELADYNAPARLSIALKTMGRFPEALAANDRALQRVYGPRRLRVLRDRAELLQAMGRTAEARATLDTALGVFDALPVGQQRPSTRQGLEQRKRSLTEAPSQGTTP